MIKNGIVMGAVWVGLFGTSLAQAQEEASPTAVEQDVELAPPETAGLTLEALYSEGGLTARDAAARARASAPSMESARLAARAAEAGADRAFVAVFPRLELSARYTRLSDVEQPSIGAEPGPEIDTAIEAVEDPAARALFRGLFDSFNFEFPVLLNQYALRASLSWPVSDVFFTILPAYRASSRFAEAQRLQVEAQEQTIDLQAREVFYSYARARAALLVAEATVGQVEAHRQNVEALVQAGVAAPVDLMRVDAQLASARLGVERARAGVAIAARSLRILMHVQGEDPIIPVGENLLAIPPAPQASRARLVEHARDRRAELRALRLVVSGREEAVTARAGERYPHLGVQANYDYANPNQRVFPQTEEFRGTWDVSVVLSWSPNDTWAGQAGVAQARAELAQARADIAALNDAVEVEVTQAYENYQAARASVEAAQTGIQAAEESYRVRVEQMRAGTAVTRDLIDSEAELTRARLEYVDTLIMLHIARARLDRAVGG